MTALTAQALPRGQSLQGILEQVVNECALVRIHVQTRPHDKTDVQMNCLHFSLQGRDHTCDGSVIGTLFTVTVTVDVLGGRPCNGYIS